MEEYKIADEFGKSKERDKITYISYIPQKMSNPKMDQTQRDALNSEASIIMCDIPQTAFCALSRVENLFIEYPKDVSKQLSYEQVLKLIDWLKYDVVGPISLQCLSHIIDYRSDFKDLCENSPLFENIIEIAENNDDSNIRNACFAILLSLIKRSPDARNFADQKHVYDNLTLFCKGEDEYLDNFFSFIEFSVKQKKYPPLFCDKFYYPISFAMQNPEYQMCGIRCINYITSNSEDSSRFVKEKIVQEGLINLINSEDAEIRINSLKCITNSFSFDKEMRDSFIELNVNAEISKSLQYVGCEKTEEFLICILNYVITFCINIEPESFNAICELIDNIKFEQVLVEFTFKVKEVALLALRTFSQFANFETITSVIDSDVFSCVASVIDKDNLTNSYNVILFMKELVTKVPTNESVEFVNTFIDSDFMDELSDISTSESVDAATNATSLIQLVNEIVGDDESD